MSEREDALEQRKSDATSDETVDDVEQSERAGAASDQPAPSPDGAFDEPDESKKADPM